MIQQYTFSGTGRMINAAGRTFRYESGSAAGATEGIRVRADGQDMGVLLPGDSLRLQRLATVWEVAPVSAACNGTVRVGQAEFDTSRLVGSVTLGDEKYTRTLQHRSFVVSQVTDGDVGDVTNRFQLWNPATSGRVLVVQSVFSRHDLAGYAALLWIDQTELATASSQGDTLVTAKGAAVSKYNGLLSTHGSVLGAAVVKAANASAKLNVFGQFNLMHVMDGDPRAPRSPIIVSPGYGLSMMSHIIGPGGGIAGVNATRRWQRTVEWDEIPVTEL